MKTIKDFKGTEGKFSVKENGGNPGMRIIDEHGNSIGDAHWPEIRQNDPQDKVLEAKANAKLFAASKDLLETLDSIYSHLKYIETEDLTHAEKKIMLLIENAINKAI